MHISCCIDLLVKRLRRGESRCPLCEKIRSGSSDIAGTEYISNAIAASCGHTVLLSIQYEIGDSFTGSDLSCGGSAYYCAS
jgi:hypothetical protein